MIQTFQVAAVKANPLVANWLAQVLRLKQGITDVKCSAATGRVRIEWKPEVRREIDLNKILKDFSLKEAYALKHGKVLKSRHPENWHSREVRDLSQVLKVNLQEGLRRRQVYERLSRFGANRIPSLPPRGRWEIFSSQFRNPSSALLAGSAGASALTGGVLEFFAILSALGVNGALGFWTENQAERSLQALSGFGPNDAKVWRSGKLQTVSLENIVPGDVIVLSQGQTVPADARLIEAEELSVDESMLTGESVPVEKKAHIRLSQKTPLVERRNMVFKGSLIVSGKGRALVVRTGLKTQAGRIQTLLGYQNQPTSRLQQHMDEMNKHLVELSAATSGVLVFLGLMHRQSPLKLFRTAISMAVAAVPEGLPTVTTWTLSRAVSRLAKRKVLVRDIKAIETLGNLHVLCLDKTGTLTENKMQVKQLALPWIEGFLSVSQAKSLNAKGTRVLMICAAVCNDDDSSTELALKRASVEYGFKIPKVRKKFKRTRSQYRSPHHRYMITWNRYHRKDYCMIKGSPEEVLQKCEYSVWQNKIRKLTPKWREKILKQNKQLGDEGLRVLGFAYIRPRHKSWIWLGLMGLRDSPRSDMKKVMRRFHQAGLRTVMITGDQARTARSIAQDLGMANGDKMVVVDMLKGKKSTAELEKLAPQAHVFARVAPEDKQRIVKALQKDGKLVGMVGDGINDALALKSSDVGIAIGESGSSVAREVANVVLLDDQISRLLEAIGLGRAASESLRKAVRYVVTTNTAEMGLMLGESGLDVPEAMEPIQILWMNMITDTFPALALAMDRPRPEVLKSAPHSPDEPLLTDHDMQEIAKDAGRLLTPVSLALLYGHARGLTKTQNQAVALNVMIVGQMLQALRGYPPEKIHWQDLWRNHRPLLAAAIGSAALHLGLGAVPGARRVFNLGRLSARDFIVTSMLPLLSPTLIASLQSEVRPSGFIKNKQHSQGGDRTYA